jgi:hypothetical protein
VKELCLFSWSSNRECERSKDVAIRETCTADSVKKERMKTLVEKRVASILGRRVRRWKVNVKMKL